MTHQSHLVSQRGGSSKVENITEKNSPKDAGRGTTSTTGVTEASVHSKEGRNFSNCFTVIASSLSVGDVFTVNIWVGMSGCRIRW